MRARRQSWEYVGEEPSGRGKGRRKGPEAGMSAVSLSPDGKEVWGRGSVLRRSDHEGFAGLGKEENFIQQR